MIIVKLFNVIFIIISIIFIILSIYPFSIYELIVKSIIYDVNKNVIKHFNLPLVKKFYVFNDVDNIYSSDGIMNIDGNIAKFNVNGINVELDIVKDLDKIVPMIYDIN